MWSLPFSLTACLSLPNFAARLRVFHPSSLPSCPCFFLFHHCNLHFPTLLMEGDLELETQRRPPPPLAGDTVYDHHLTRSSLDASSLTAENCKDAFRGSRNVTLDKCTTWTNEKHNSYLYHLEMSFVEKLYQSKPVLPQCSGHNLGDISISRKIDGCSEKIKHAGDKPTPSSTSAASHASLERKRTRYSLHRGAYCLPSPAKMPTSLKLIRTCKQEGTGQNFSDELNSESGTKRLKIALGDGLHRDQVVPSSECSPADYSVTNS